MSKRWWTPFDGMEELSFKRVPEGWVFGAPNPWLFGTRSYYVMSEQQKVVVAGHLRGFMRFMFAMIIVMAALGVPLMMSVLNERPFTMLAAEMAVALGVAFAANAYLHRRLRPILAGLARTSRRITPVDAFRTQVTVYSTRFIMVLLMISVTLLAGSALRPLLGPDGWDLWSVIGVVLFGSGSLYWMALLIAKRWQPAI